MDFRNVETKHKTNQSTEQLANRFQLSYSFVDRLLKPYQTKQRVKPSPHGGGKPPLLVAQDNDGTLQQLWDHEVPGLA